ncbi:MAG: aldo/keto reductase [Treponemataceae bacterium]|nr:aldo/keto reductase [Treponemataceae bacterium]
MFDEVKKNFGFGCMRLPMNGGKIDYAEFNKMIDAFIENGFNYFDTAHGYHSGKSETALRDCLVARYPRDKFILTNKLTQPYFNSEADVRTFFESQLKICGVDYFDFYLMHAQSKEIFSHFKKYRAYEQALKFKAEGKIKHFGISFHDTADVLDEILNEYPQIEVVQIQLNYVDYDDPAVQSRKCLEVCNKHRKPVIIMEPVKGGNLVNLPDDAKKYFEELGSASTASYAIRFAAGQKGVFMVLSGMSDMAQMNDNISYMKNFKPLDEKEMKAVQNVCAVFNGMNLIPCTACRYCTDGCPKNISIPDLFACMNTKKHYHDWNADYYYNEVHTKNSGKASDCIKCGKCENACPQHLPIRDLLQEVAKEFEK